MQDFITIYSRCVFVRRRSELVGGWERCLIGSTGKIIIQGSEEALIPAAIFETFFYLLSLVVVFTRSSRLSYGIIIIGERNPIEVSSMNDSSIPERDSRRTGGLKGPFPMRIMY